VQKGIASPAARSVPPSSMRAGQTSRDDGQVTVQYVAVSPIVVRGSVTGRIYKFSGASPTQVVERRDAGPLLQSRFFRMA
jgi:hypothetical protein